MAITVTSPTPAIQGWIKNANSADASGGEEIFAAPGAGSQFKVTHIAISSDSAISVSLGTDEAAGSLGTTYIGPVTFAAGQMIEWHFGGLTGGMLWGDNKAIDVDASGAGNINVFIEGTTV